jgi:hypothetical protein
VLRTVDPMTGSCSPNRALAAIERTRIKGLGEIKTGRLNEVEAPGMFPPERLRD